MKLPQYDNRPSPGTPLYDDSSRNSPWDDVKFPLLAIGLPIAGLICLGFAVVGLLRAFYH